VPEQQQNQPKGIIDTPAKSGTAGLLKNPNREADKSENSGLSQGFSR